MLRKGQGVSEDLQSTLYLRQKLLCLARRAIRTSIHYHAERIGVEPTAIAGNGFRNRFAPRQLLS